MTVGRAQPRTAPGPRFWRRKARREPDFARSLLDPVFALPGTVPADVLAAAWATRALFPVLQRLFAECGRIGREVHRALTALIDAARLTGPSPSPVFQL